MVNDLKKIWNQFVMFKIFLIYFFAKTAYFTVIIDLILCIAHHLIHLKVNLDIF